MTGAEIILKFRNMVDDTLDGDFEYELLNDAKDEVEGMLDWEILVIETSYPVTAGYSYASELGSLPVRFASPIRMTEGTSDIDYTKVDFTDRAARVNASFGYFIDLANDRIHLSGSNHTAKTMYFYHTAYSQDIEETTSWVFPNRFHSILPLKMAELYYLSDAGERGRSWDDKWSTQFERKLNAMFVWNDKLKLTGRRSRSVGKTPSPKAVN